jgi:hypothetical protein
VLGDSQRAVGGEITVFNKAWNGLGKVGETSCFNIALVMPNGISARYQGKAYDGTCGEWVCFGTPS